MISICVPTVRGREEYHAKCCEMHAEYATVPSEIITMRNFDCCGKAWNAFVPLAKYDLFLFTADDLTPHFGWDVAAIEAVERGMVPSPALYHPDGTLYFADGPSASIPEDWTPGCDSGLYCTTYVPFCSRTQHARIGPIIETHYGSDDWFSYRARKVGIPVVFRAPYAFTHHHAMPGRGAGMDEYERHMHDTRILEAAVHADAD